MRRSDQLRPMRRRPKPGRSCKRSAGPFSSGHLDLDLARTELYPLRNAHRQQAIFETGCNLGGLELAAQGEASPVLRGPQVRVKGGHPRRQIERDVAFDRQTVPIGLDVESLLRDAGHLRLYRNLMHVLEDIDRGDQYYVSFARPAFDRGGGFPTFFLDG